MEVEVEGVAEEFETLGGVYGDAFAEGVDGDGGRWCELRFHAAEHARGGATTGGGGCAGGGLVVVVVVVRVQVRPGAARPEVEVVDSSRVLDLDAVRAEVAAIGWAPGEASLFRVAEAVRSRVAEWEERAEMMGAASGKDEGEPPVAQQTGDKGHGVCSRVGMPLVVGEPVVDRKSCFQCFVGSPVSSVEDVAAAKESLLRSSSKIGRATHIMVAYRFSTHAGNIIQDSDDGGESGAGKRLLFIIECMASQVRGGGVVVFCCRWHGGIQLGPARFAHIQNAARSALALLAEQERHGDLPSDTRTH